MSKHDENTGASQHERMIIAQRQRVQEVRSEFIGEAVYGNTSEAAHLELARVCVEYWQMLREYHDEAVIDGLPDIEKLQSKLGQQTKMIDESAGLKRGGNYRDRPAVLEVSVGEILELLDQLDDAAKQLGFSASANDHTPVFGVDPDYEGGDDDDASPTTE
jgi:hypothetical protein